MSRAAATRHTGENPLKIIAGAADVLGTMSTHDHDRPRPTSKNPDPRRIVDLEAAPAGPDTPIHNIALDLQGAPPWRLWAMVAVLGAFATLALMVA